MIDSDDRPSADSFAVQKHLDIMQGIISRMAENSRSCKLWCVTLVAATIIVVARTEVPMHSLIALVPTFLFFSLDLYYLALEREFIKSYRSFSSKLHENQLQWTDVYTVERENIGLTTLRRCLRSVSICVFYPLVTTMIFLTWIVMLPPDRPYTCLPCI